VKNRKKKVGKVYSLELSLSLLVLFVTLTEIPKTVFTPQQGVGVIRVTKGIINATISKATMVSKVILGIM
jgi:hypothetical protein